jgi:hypothetical protein
MTQLSEEKLIAWLDGEVTANEAAELEQLLQSDSLARAKYERLQHIRGALKPALSQRPIPAFTEQVMQQLHHPGAKRASMWLRPATVVAGVLAVSAVIVFFIANPFATQTVVSDEFTPRTAKSSESPLARLSGVDVYLHENSDPLNRRLVTADMTLGADDGFSFVVHNRTGKRCYLMIVAMDARKHLHWFYPSADSDAQGWKSIPVEAAPSMFPLPDGVTPGEVAPGKFEMIALITEGAQTVDAVAERLKSGGSAQLKKAYPDASIQVFQLNAMPAGDNR